MGWKSFVFSDDQGRLVCVSSRSLWKALVKEYSQDISRLRNATKVGYQEIRGKGLPEFRLTQDHDPGDIPTPFSEMPEPHTLGGWADAVGLDLYSS